MNVVYITDDGFAFACGVSMRSLLENNRELAVLNIFIMDYHITAENRKKLQNMADEFSRNIRFLDISDFAKKIPFSFDTEGFHPIVLSRLFLTDYMENSMERLLYIDCDTLVTGSLKPLEELLLEEYDLAAVPELYMPSQCKKVSVGFDKDETYYNAGVLFINLQRWREQNLKDKFLAFYRDKNGQLLYNDQDIINYCCKDTILTLPQWFNQNSNLPYFPRWFLRRLRPEYVLDPPQTYKEYLKRPVIAHYQGDERPWIKGSHNAYKDQYNDYRSRTPWSDRTEQTGKEWYMFCYHALNLITLVMPHFRILFSSTIGIRKFKWFGK